MTEELDKLIKIAKHTPIMTNFESSLLNLIEELEDEIKLAYNQGIEDAAKAMEHNSLHCAALIREIKK